MRAGAITCGPHLTCAGNPSYASRETIIWHTIWAGNDVPARPIPLPGQFPMRAGATTPDGPYLTGARNPSYAIKGARPRRHVWAGNDLPSRPIPLLDECQLTSIALSGVPHSPDIARRESRH